MQIKDRHAKESSFSRALLAGLICGIVGAALIAFYTFEYRKMTEFKGLGFVEPLVIFISVPLLMVIAGFLFLGMVEQFKNGEMLYILLAAVLTIGGIVVMLVVKQGPVLSGGKGLWVGVMAIGGLISAFLLPFLGTHPKIFMEEEELLESAQ